MLYLDGLMLSIRKIPGYPVISRYIKSSYQNDPVRSVIELLLIFFIIRYIFSTRYSPEKNNYVKLSEKEIDDLVDEWIPENLVSDLTEIEKLEIEKIPVIIGSTGSKIRLTSFPTRTIINLSSYNFLNFISSELLQKKAIEALRKYGVGACGPPGFYGTQDVHMVLEQMLANFLGTESAILYSQTYSTISSVIPAFSKRGDILVVDRGVNFAIQKGIQISRSTIRWFDHNDFSSLENVLEDIRIDQMMSHRPLARRFIIVEGLSETFGDICNLAKIIELKKKYKYRLILDESWSFGTLGKSGRGVTEYYGCDPQDVDILVGSLSTCLCSGGGFCAGTVEIVDHQRITGASYVFSAALPASLAVIASQAILMLQQPSSTDYFTALRKNSNIFRSIIEMNEFIDISSHKDSPIIIFRIKNEFLEKYAWSFEETEGVLQEIVDECLNNGVLIMRVKKINSQEIWKFVPSIRICINIGLSKKEIEKSAIIVKSMISKLLSQFYRHILSLRDVLKYRFKNYDEEWLKRIENLPILSSLLDGCIVCFNEKHKMSPLEFNITKIVSSQTEVVNSVIRRIFMKSRGKPANIISQGYRRGNDTIQTATTGAFGDAIVNYFPNSHVTFLRSDNWETLLQFVSVGDRFMVDLLLETSMFMALPQDNYFQFCGIPLHELSPLISLKRCFLTKSYANKSKINFSMLYDNSNKSKIRKFDDIEFPVITSSNNSLVNIRSRNEIMIIRSKIFYARPMYNSHNKILFGLYPLTRFNDSTNLLHSISLLVDIFPRQFHLHSVFTSIVDRKDTVQFLKDCTVKKCYFDINTLDTSQSYIDCHYELLDNHLNIRNTQMDVDFIGMTTPYSHVSRFLIAIIKKIIPKGFYGSDSNFENILDSINTFVRMRRFESISLHSLMHSLKVKTVSWLEFNNNCRMSLWDFQKRISIFSELIYWTFDSLIIPLIRSHFYVTESSVYRNKVLYFRHDIWKSLSEPQIYRIKSLMFSDLSLVNLKDVSSDFYLGYSYIRLLPKEIGVRPIINLKKKQIREKLDVGNKRFKKITFMPSINSMLNTVFYERSSDYLGSSLFSINDIYRSIKMFKKYIINNHLQKKRLYFAKVDIKNCFDTIDQDKVLELVVKNLKEDEYILRRFVLITSNFGKFNKKFITRANSSDNLCYFKKFADDISHLYRHSVIVDQVVYSFKDRDDIVKLLYKHVKGNLIGKKFYKQLKGIPQGSILSTMLCAYFYGNLEKKCLEFIQQPNTILLRLVDDFLLISLDKTIAKKFLELGYPEYNCYVNPDKSLVNFEVNVNGFKVNRLLGRREFPYCGNLINMVTLDVKKDYSRLSGKGMLYNDLFCISIDLFSDIDHTLTIEYSHTPGNAILIKLFQLLKLSAHPLFMDTDFNSYYTVLLNIYTSFVFCAMKMHRYIKMMKGQRPNQNKILIFIEECSTFMLSYLKSRELTALKAKCSVNFGHVKWLAFYAFWKIFRKKQTLYPEVLFKLNLYLSSVKKRRDLKVISKIISPQNLESFNAFVY
ncbi:hypothetical protein PMAC_001153 [Pneumocystis sp. 'macacae']|nr:hypothetical protein PMAC_001153 [Pneumocystis sp. 'macacae']